MARRVAEADAAIQRDLEELMERITPLVQCCAETVMSFEVLRGRWQTDAGRLHAALDEIATSVGEPR